jgi:hypothetical protein
MTKQTYWIADEVGTHALVTGADERDRWVRGDWALAEEPTEGWVHIWHEGIEQPGRVTVAALRDLWAARAWVAGPPPGGVHPFAPEPPAEPESKPKSRSAAGGSTEEK